MTAPTPSAAFRMNWLCEASPSARSARVIAFSKLPLSYAEIALSSEDRASPESPTVSLALSIASRASRLSSV